MKALSNVTVRSELSPTGAELRYLLTGTARVYASAKSWAKALQVPGAMMVWFEKALAITAMVKGNYAGGELEMSYLDKPVYRWHAVAEALRGFDRRFYEHSFESRPTSERAEIKRFHDNYERVVAWGYDLQERALSSVLEAQSNAGKAVTQAELIEAMKQAVAPRLQHHDDKLREHDIVISEIKEAVPALQDEGDFISVKQATTEKGLDATQMPLYPGSRETLSGLAGQMLKSNGAEQGPSVISRLDGQSVAASMNTYRRRDIYAVLAEIHRKKPAGLPL
jgi:hypothetical protein